MRRGRLVVERRRALAPRRRRLGTAAAPRRQPRAVERDQPDAGALQPAQDALGLLGRGRRRRAGRRRARPRRVDQRRPTTASGRRPRAATPAAASRPCRTTTISQPPSWRGRAATSSAQPVSADEALHPGGSADERGQPVAVRAPRPRTARRDDRRRSGALERGDDGPRRRPPWRRGRPSACAAYVVDGLARPRTARRSGPSRRVRRLGSAGAATAAWCTGARERLVHRRDAPARPGDGGERPEVGRAVVADLAHERQPRERLDGQLDPEHALGEPGPPVVARLVLRDQAQLADLGLERRSRTTIGVTRSASPTISAMRRAGLAGGEVGADAGAQVLGLADVEHLAARVANR